ncbi:MAG: pro-sigmaK processing inhibitor BofA family protein [Oscillospiraceae bacterium]|nr:pro-sigmaK processing inhibitor BofA family protein [Oscillospiraceae bacterium]
MENFVSILIPVALVVLLLRLIAAPLKWTVKIAVNSLAGLICLWLLNWIAGFTGIVFPINAITAAIAGFLGLPGIALLAMAQIIL